MPAALVEKAEGLFAEFLGAPRPGKVLERRVYFLAEELGLDRERVRD